MNCVEFFRQKGISLVWAMRYSPCERKKNVSGRQYNSFMYMESGRYLLTFADGELQIEAGDLIFFPKGSVHSSELISEDADCIQVEFEITGYELPCPKHPIRLQKIEKAPELLGNIVSLYTKNDPAAFIEAIACLYQLFAAALHQLVHIPTKSARIYPAVQYIEQHLSEPIDIGKLAQLCTISLSQLRRLFKQEYHLTPVAYRNNLRMDKAKFMLYYGYATISEIAQELGFDNVYAFSNMFKKHTGLSPSEYMKRREHISLMKDSRE